VLKVRDRQVALLCRRLNSHCQSEPPPLGCACTPTPTPLLSPSSPPASLQQQQRLGNPIAQLFHQLHLASNRVELRLPLPPDLCPDSDASSQPPPGGEDEEDEEALAREEDEAERAEREAAGEMAVAMQAPSAAKDDKVAAEGAAAPQRPPRATKERKVVVAAAAAGKEEAEARDGEGEGEAGSEEEAKEDGEGALAKGARKQRRRGTPRDAIKGEKDRTILVRECVRAHRCTPNTPWRWAGAFGGDACMPAVSAGLTISPTERAAVARRREFGWINRLRSTSR